MLRKKIAAANWKMNLTIQDAEILLNALLEDKYELKETQQVIFGVPFPYLSLAKNKIQSQSHIYISAQNCSSEERGAFTGEVSTEMLKSMGISYVILGHSERRQYFSETETIILKKMKLCFENNLHPIYCCGEPLDEREKGTQNAFIQSQIEKSILLLSEQEIQKTVIAYEPIWAIGTGKTATEKEAQEVHFFIRNLLRKQFGDIADNISILYGGSVKASNANSLFSQPDIDGGLVGGASLIAEEFKAIIKSLP